MIAVPVGGVRVARRWLAVAVVLVARAYIAFTATLAVAALAPALVDWNSYVVRSGSMEPDVAIGDVVVGRPLAPAEDPEVGKVFVFADPGSGSRPLLVHRVVKRQQDGQWVTQGDANASPDVAPVPREGFHDQARILVPFIGRPVRWWRERDLLPLAAWLAFTGAALAILVAGRAAVPRHRHKGPRLRRNDRARHAPPSRRRTTKPGPAVLAMTAIVGLAVLVTGPGIASASAGFTATSRNPGNAWTMAESPQQRYSSAVLADSPHFYYLLDEASGSTTRDESDNGRHGLVSSLAGYRSAGALPNNFGYSMNLGGTGRVVSSGGLYAPATFTLELWFRTTTNAGGKLIGFESTQSATGSLLFDRHVTMRTDGRVVYGDWNANQIRTVTSPASYNDGSWHHLALTAVPNGSQQTTVLHVDGQQVATGVTSRIGEYAGWWRVGHGKVRAASGITTNGGFPGQVDQVAVYRTALPAARVRAHYAAR